MQDLFSRRYPVKPPLTRLIYDDVPFDLRREFLRMLAEYSRRAPILVDYEKLYDKLFRIPEIKRKYDFLQSVANWSHDGFDELVNRVEWFTFLDCVQSIMRHLHEEALEKGLVYKKIHAALRHPEEATVEEFPRDVNYLFQDHGLGYEIRELRVERVGSTFVDKGVERARVLLQDPRFAGPDQQFQRALGAFNTRPEPDCANAIKDAVGALEGTARIVTGDLKSTLSDILKANQTLKSMVAPQLYPIFEKIYAYRGAEEGVAHGQTQSLALSVEDAELIIGVCASLIIYLAKKASARTV
ncbi:MAG: hypothetical protein EXR60_01450 [Dehalococcoidia bacterium]|nr:hypothetical protein [Dehalococcoidia bacterium]